MGQPVALKCTLKWMLIGARFNISFANMYKDMESGAVKYPFIPS
jgi:hypothetical protein